MWMMRVAINIFCSRGPPDDAGELFRGPGAPSSAYPTQLPDGRASFPSAWARKDAAQHAKCLTAADHFDARVFASSVSGSDTARRVLSGVSRHLTLCSLQPAAMTKGAACSSVGLYSRNRARTDGARRCFRAAIERCVDNGRSVPLEKPSVRAGVARTRFSNEITRHADTWLCGSCMRSAFA